MVKILTTKLYIITTLIFLMLIINVSTINAWDFDNVLEAEFIDESEYPRLKIVNTYGLGSDQAIINIEEHTGECLINCYTIGNIWLANDEPIFSEVNFEDKNKNSVARNYNIYIEVEDKEDYQQPIYEDICDVVWSDINNTFQEECVNTLTGYEEVEPVTYDWKKYTGDVLPAGYYRWMIESKRDEIKLKESIDMSFGLMGISSTEVREYYVWWNSNWNKRRELGFSGHDTDTLINFTVMYNITFDGNMQVDFEDIRFVDGACSGTQTDELSYEFDIVYDSNSALVWIKIPSLASGENNTKVCMYYDNVAATYGNDTTGSWDDGYLLVMHMTDQGTTGLLNSVDGNATFMTMFNTPTFEAGTYGQGVNMSVITSNKYALGSANPPVASNNLTLEMEMYPFGASGGNRRFFGHFTVSGSDQGQHVSEDAGILGYTQTNGVTKRYTLAFNTWSNYMVEYDGIIKVNVDKVTSSGILAGSYTGNLDAFGVWKMSHSDGADRWGDAMYDEFRASNVPRSEGWTNRSYDNRNLSKFTTSPEESTADITVTLFTPLAGQEILVDIINFSCDATTDTSMDGLLNLTLILDGVDNFTVFNSSAGQNLSINVSYNLTDGNYNWTCSGTSSMKTEVLSVRTFIVHVTNPTLNIITPTGPQGISIGQPITLSWIISEAGADITSHIKNCSYTYNSVLTNLNQSNCIDLNQTNFTYIIGVNNLLMSVTDEFNLMTTGSTSWNFEAAQGNLTYEGNVSETSQQNFSMNMSFNTTTFQFVTANLNYNGSLITATSIGADENRLFTAALDIPLINSTLEEFKNFHWEIALTNTTDTVLFNSSLLIQNVSKIFFAECNATLTTVAANFTAFDENNLTRIDPFIFQGTFNVWLGNGTIKRTYSINNITANESRICIKPTNKNMLIDAVINYDGPIAGEYVARDYNYAGKIFNGTRQDIPLFLLFAGDSTSFILFVRDQVLIPVANALIEIQRYYPGEDIFRIVQVPITSDDGKTVGFFKTETVEYRFVISKNGTILLTTGKRKIVGESTPFTLTFTVGEPLDSPLASVSSIEDLNGTISYSNITNLITYSYEDVGGNFEQARLLVTENKFAIEDIVICNETKIINPSIIVCNVSSISGSITAKGYNTRTGEREKLAASASLNTNTDSQDAFGLLGLYLAWFLILTSYMVSIWNPTVGLASGAFTVVAVNLIGFATFPPAYIFGVVGVSIILAILIKT